MFVDKKTHLTFLYKLVLFRSVESLDGKHSHNNEDVYYSNTSDKLIAIANAEVKSCNSKKWCMGTVFLHDEYVDDPISIYKFRSKR